MPKSPITTIRQDKNSHSYKQANVGCLVLSQDNKIVLQQRDGEAPTFPHHLSTFGGGIEKGESPLEALVRELHEELGAIVIPATVVALGVLTEEETHASKLLYAYFWHDRRGTITGCYEGSANYYDDPDQAEQHPKVMDDVRWMIRECKRRKLI